MKPEEPVWPSSADSGRGITSGTFYGNLRRYFQAVDLSRDSPDQTNFPGYSSFWDTVKYNPAFQGHQMRPDSLKFPVFI